MKRLYPLPFLLFALIIISLLPARAQEAARTQHAVSLHHASPESQGFMSDRLPRIDRFLQQCVDSAWISGASAIVVRNGGIVYDKAIGFDNVEKKIPVKNKAIFRMASQTKAITSVAVMMLYEEGRFLLDDPISKYLPEFKSPQVIDKFNEADTTYTTVKAKREIKIRDLLTHTSGISYPEIGEKMMKAIYAKEKITHGIDAGDVTLAPMMKKLATLPLAHQPGERFTYGLNLDILGYLVEVLSGMSFDEFLHKRIFTPLGMRDTYFYLPKEKQGRLWTVYTLDSLRHIVNATEWHAKRGGPNPDYPNTKGTYFSGGSGLCSTPFDCAIFMQMMLNGGEYNGRRILSRNTIRMMTMNQIGDLSLYGGSAKFGFGFAVLTELGSSKLPMPAGVYYWNGIFSTYFWIDPKENIVAQLVMQQYPQTHPEIQEKFKVLVYQALR